MTGAMTVRDARWAQATGLSGFPGAESRLRVDGARPLYLAGGGRPSSRCDKKGRDVEQALAIVAAPAARPVARVLHTAVCRLPAPAR